MRCDPHQVLFGRPGESPTKSAVEYEDVGARRRVAYEYDPRRRGS